MRHHLYDVVEHGHDAVGDETVLFAKLYFAGVEFLCSQHLKQILLKVNTQNVFTRLAVAVSCVGHHAEYQAHQLQCGRVIKEIRSPKVFGQDVLAELEKAELDDTRSESWSRPILDTSLDEA